MAFTSVLKRHFNTFLLKRTTAFAIKNIVMLLLSSKLTVIHNKIQFYRHAEDLDQQILYVKSSETYTVDRRGRGGGFRNFS